METIEIPTEEVVVASTTEPKSWIVPMAVGVGVIAASGIGYILWRRRSKKTEVNYDKNMVEEVIDFGHCEGLISYQERVTDEPIHIPQAKLVEDNPNLNRATNPAVNYNGMHKRVTPPIPEAAWQNPPTLDEVEEPEEELPVIHNVFAASNDSWNLEFELQNRDPLKPYVIHADEFAADDMGCRQVSLTYYAGDDTMVDSYDTIVHNHAKLLGELKFNHGSKDPNVVYIRNEAEQMEYEVVGHPGSYAIEVLGDQMDAEIERELRHSHSVPRMRRE